ncbi:MAG: cobyrinate a,c-diamide synthase [Bryobacteraceae bacterium]|nr:cobyrinate a,c-diamide synthase [Bryobacteraceae bacterium]
MKGPLAVPRLVVAGASGSSGKTLVSLGLALAARSAGVAVRAFKKGPDYIDAAWLSWATGHPARNLDTQLMGFPAAAACFARRAVPDGVNVVEGNRGLFDGSDARGTHSTAELAKLLDAPVVLALNAAKMTRTAAAWVLGCQRMDPALEVTGVILNNVATGRHERVAREAIESVCGVPVLGAIPRIADEAMLPQRHLGLAPPEEFHHADALAKLLRTAYGHVDLERLLAIARRARPMWLEPFPRHTNLRPSRGGASPRIGYLRDSAFTFYYPDNLEALEDAGARLAAISSLDAGRLPEDLDALYIGGGFPETHAARLAANRGFLASVAAAAGRGLPIYAECGGLMLLARAIHWQGRAYAMAGVLPFDVKVHPTPRGHGYAELRVDRTNPFFPVGLTLKGHEFHYSAIALDGAAPATACAVSRGTGCFDRRDGVLAGNVWAGYTHLHAAATPEWAEGMVDAAFARSPGRAGAGYIDTAVSDTEILVKEVLIQ